MTTTEREGIVTQQKYMRPGLSFAVGKAVEELGELQAALGKTLRWGWNSFNPELPMPDQETNLAWVKREIEDVRGALDNLENELKSVKPSAAIDPATVTQHQIEYAAQEVLHRRGFAFYDDPMEGGQDAYDISCEALEEVRIIVRALASAPSEASKDETAWLIELRGNHPPAWWSLSDSEDGGEWSRKVDDALRFSREKDAQAYINDIGWTDVFACEHMWCDPRREAPKPPGQEPGGDPGVGRIAELETLNGGLADKVRNLTTLLDQQLGTPCEEIRHAQEVEKLQALALSTADRDAIREALRSQRDWNKLVIDSDAGPIALRHLYAPLVDTQTLITDALALIREG